MFCKNCGAPINENAVACMTCGFAKGNGDKFCATCGKEINPGAAICTNCGCAVTYQSAQKDEVKKSESGLKIAAKVLMILGTVVMGFYIIPLAWCIPMTISYFNKVKRGEKISTAFKVCSLLFVSMIGGILMLCDQD